jgi:Fe-Mn family superoxide dismutase
MRPGGAKEPSGALAQAVERYGGLDKLKADVNDAGVKRFGSGWAWVVKDGDGIAVMSTPNQDSPLMEGKTPLLGIDVWEHSYYLKYQNQRPAYLEAWWNVVNWDAVQQRFESAR